jgi:hypothetical protein
MRCTHRDLHRNGEHYDEAWSTGRLGVHGNIFMNRLTALSLGTAFVTVFGADAARATVYTANPGDNLSALANSVQSGDVIQLNPGTYTSGIYPNAGFTGVTIRSTNPANPAVLSGVGMQFPDAHDITVSDIVMQNTAGNYINAFNSDSSGPAATNFTFRNMTFQNPVYSTTVETIGLKMAGVDGFAIDNCRFLGFGNMAGALGIDGVGVHQGTVTHSVFNTTGAQVGGGGGYGIQFKGASADITIRANRFDDSYRTGQRGINNGGSTGVPYFRPQPPPPYEATRITMEGNVFSGWRAPADFASSDGGTFRNNLVYRPIGYVAWITTESIINGITYQAKNGSVLSNRFIWNQGDLYEPNFTFVNIGSSTLPDTFTFAGNQWYNATNSSNSAPHLGSITETGSIYGVNPNVSVDKIVPWTFGWGLYLANDSLATDIYTITGQSEPLLLATPGAGGALDLGAAYPLTGTWTFQPADTSVSLSAMTDAVLIRQSLVPEPATLGLLVLPFVLLLNRKAGRESN